MLINSAGYKVLTSVEQYLELVSSSLPGELGGMLGVPPHHRAAERPTGIGGQGWLCGAGLQPRSPPGRASIGMLCPS